MLSMVIAVVVGFALLVWRSYRVDARRASDGRGFEAEGKLRWTADGFHRLRRKVTDSPPPGAPRAVLAAWRTGVGGREPGRNESRPGALRARRARPCSAAWPARGQGSRPAWP